MIIPGILEKSWKEIVSKIEIVHNRNLQSKDIINRIQIDFCDGKYVTSKTWSPVVEDPNIVSEIQNIIDKGLPYWEELDFEADLMVLDLNSYIDKVSQIGFTHVVLHGEDEFMLKEAIMHAKELMLEVGICSRDPELIKNLLTSHDILYGDMINNIDYVQIMGIANIGYQGQEFREDTLDIIEDMKQVIDKVVKEKKISKIIKIQIDGGMNSDTSELCLARGARNIVVGSAYYQN